MHIEVNVTFSSNDLLESDEKSPDGKPLLSVLEESGKYTLSVWSFGQLETVLRLAGERKMSEARSCLEGRSSGSYRDYDFLKSHITRNLKHNYIIIIYVLVL